MNNRLQFLRSETVFNTREEALNALDKYVGTGFVIKDAEPIVLKYGDAEKPSLLVVVGYQDEKKEKNGYMVIDNAQILKDIAAISATASTNKVSVKDSDSILLSAVTTTSGQVISGLVKVADYYEFSGRTDTGKKNILLPTTRGLFTYVDLQLNDNGKLVFYVNDFYKEITLPSARYIASGKYDTETESLIFTYSDKEDITVSLSNLIDQWNVDNKGNNVTLEKTRTTGKESTLSANVNVSTGETNVLKEILENGKKVLAVEFSKNKDSILFKNHDGDLQAVAQFSCSENNITFTHSDYSGNITTDTYTLNTDAKVSTDETNVIYSKKNSAGEDEIYANVNLSYSPTTNQLIFERSNQKTGTVETKNIQLNSAKLINRVYYSPSTKTLTIEYEDGSGKTQHVDIPMTDILEGLDWKVANNGHSVELTKTDDILTADVKISDNTDNILVDTPAHQLYVKGTADNIKYDATTVKSALDDINSTVAGHTNALTKHHASIKALSGATNDDSSVISIYGTRNLIKEVSANTLGDAEAYTDSKLHTFDDTNTVDITVDGTKVTADVKIATNHDNNILTTDGANGLYVSNSGITKNASDIAKVSGDVITNTNDIAGLKTASGNLETELQKEIADRKDSDEALSGKPTDSSSTISIYGTRAYVDEKVKGLSSNTFVDTDTIDFTLNGTEVTADVKIDTRNANNILSANTDGLYVSNSGITANTKAIEDEVLARQTGDISLSGNSGDSSSKITIYGTRKYIDEKVNGLSSNTFSDTDTIKFNTAGTEVTADVKIATNHTDTNIIKTDGSNGLYAEAKLEYNAATNKLKFTTSNVNSGSTVNEIQLNAGSLIDDMYIDATGDTKYLVIEYHTTSSSTKQTLELNVADLLTDISAVTGSNDTVEITIVNTSKGKHISATSRISSHSDNMLVNDDGELYVCGSGVSKNTSDILDIYSKLDSANDEIDAIEASVGLNDDGTYDTGKTSGANYIKNSNTFINNDIILDSKLGELSGSVTNMNVDQIGNSDGSTYIGAISETDGKISATSVTLTNKIDNTTSANTAAPTTKAVAEFVDDYIDNMNVNPISGNGSFISSVSQVNGKVSATTTSFETNVSGNSASTIAPTTEAVYKFVTATTANTIDGLDVNKIGDDTTYITWVSEEDGKISANSVSAITSITSSNSGSTNLPTTNAVTDYVTSAISSNTSSLSANTISGDGKYISAIWEKDGIVSAETKSFASAITNSNSGSTSDIPSICAVTNYINSTTQNLSASTIGSGISYYLYAMREDNGIISGAAEPFVSAITSSNSASTVAPTTSAVTKFVLDEISANTFDKSALSASPITSGDGYYIDAISEKDGIVSGSVKAFVSAITSGTSASTVAPTTSAVTKFVLDEISANTFDKSALSANTVGGDNKYINAISEKDGVISASTKEFASAITSTNSGSTNDIPSICAVTNYLSGILDSLSAETIDGGDGYYINAISEKDGVISGSVKAFVSGITSGTSANTVPPTTKAVVEYVEDSLSDVVDSLSSNTISGEGQYISAIWEKDGIVSAETKSFASAITNSNSGSTSDIPSICAVTSYVSATTQNLSASTIGSGIPYYIYAMREDNGIISGAVQAFVDEITSGTSASTIPPSTSAIMKVIIEDELVTAAALNAIKDGAGLNENGDYIVNSGSPIISSATNITDAINDIADYLDTTDFAYKSELTASTIGSDPSYYISEISETDGIIAGKAEPFTSAITSGTSASTIAPSTKAVVEYVEDILETLSADTITTGISGYVYAIREDNGIISGAVNPFVSAITSETSASTVAPTTDAIMKIVAEDERVTSNALNKLRLSIGLNYSGDYVPKTSSKYISAATTVDAAIDFLDDAINDNTFWKRNGMQIEPINSAYTVGAIGFYETSDKNYKHDIASISSNDIKKLDKIELKEFVFDDDVTNTKKYGVIAQDLEDADLNNLVHTDTNGKKSVDYISFLILKVKQLEERINQLENK